VLAVLIIWEILTDVTHTISTKFLTSPVGIAQEFVTLLRTGYVGTPLWVDFAASLGRTFTGFVLSAVVAIPIGLWMGLNPYVRAVLAPLFNLLRPVPAIALIPLMVLWFGIGETSKIIVIFLASFLYVVLNTSAGVATIPVGLIRAALNLGASRTQLFRYVIFPASLPSIMTGLKTGLAVSWAVVVAAELIAAQRGLGYMIEDAATFYRIKDVYVGVILIGIIGLLMNSSLEAIERRALHWAGKS
jgi:ABC-type nitrate/sulfonate/bicarbonate transport system permease component